jgi:hypothetical protein
MGRNGSVVRERGNRAKITRREAERPDSKSVVPLGAATRDSGHVYR